MLRKLRAYAKGDTSVYTFERSSLEEGGYLKIQCPFKESRCKTNCAYYSIKRGKIKCGKHTMGILA
jgi:hypothetical protein